jgi:uncharacterized protein DUF6338
MAPQTGTAVLVLAAFVLPGFVTLMISERTHAVAGDVPTFDRLLLALYYSALIYGVLLVVALLVMNWNRHDIVELAHGKKPLAETAGLALAAVLIVPALFATLARLWLRSGLRGRMLDVLRINPTHRTATAWDHFFEQEEEAMLRLTTRDGRVLGGYYGPESFAAYGSQRGGLFIEQQWELDGDGWFQSPVEASIGLWISHDEIVSFEVYTVSR